MLIKGLQAGQTTFNKAKFLEKGRMHQRESDGGLSSPGNQRRIRDFCMHQPISQINTQFWAPVEPIILIQARVRFKPGSRHGAIQKSSKVTALNNYLGAKMDCFENKSFWVTYILIWKKVYQQHRAHLCSTSVASGVVGITVIDPRTRVVKPERRNDAELVVVLVISFMDENVWKVRSNFTWNITRK